MAGIQGKILHVNLSTSEIHIEELGMDRIAKYLGSRGLNAEMLWRYLKPGVDPLSPENVIIFGAGTLTGTKTPSAGRTTITTKSPLTGWYLKTVGGGNWGYQLKRAGFDNIVVYGRAEEPVYIDIHNGQVQIVPAKDLWGKDVRETTQILEERGGDRRLEVACIGPAGENGVKFASIMLSTYFAAGRGGGGTVMGSKNLKAIAVSGNQPIEVHDRKQIDAWIEQVRKGIANAPSAKTKTLYGTAGSMAAFSELGILPTNNFQRGKFPDAYKLSGQYLVEAGYMKRRKSCHSCPIACHRYTEVDEGKYAGTYAGGPEYETVAGFGPGCGISNTEAVLHMNELCNIYGLDTISAASVIQWLIESNTRGALNEAQQDGLDLDWGNEEAVIELIHRITYRQGVGDMLAEGVRSAARQVGGDTWKWAVESKGLEQSRVETRSAKGYALAFSVNPRGPDHLHAQPIAEFGLRQGGIDLIERITGDAKYANPMMTEKRAEIVVYHEDWYSAVDSFGLCTFPTTADFAILPESMAGLITATLGFEITEEELLKAGRRILTLEKAFNVREGATREDDRLPWRFMHEENPDRPGSMNSPEELNGMLDEYYALHGWDSATSWPTRETLEALDLKFVADELEQLDKLPHTEGVLRAAAKE